MTRARLLHAWPTLSHLFGIRPWELDLLTPVELDEYLTAADDFERSQRR